jgi:hypothetical protein
MIADIGFATECLSVARDLLSRSDPDTSGLWPRAAAFLGRQALEDAMVWVWVTRTPGLEECSKRAQLLCLPQYLEDEDLAESASHVYGRLSLACHHHPYELSPTADELTAWLDEVERVVAKAAQVARGVPDS